MLELGKKAAPKITFLTFREAQRFNSGKVLEKINAGFSGSSGTFPLERLKLREALWSTVVVTEADALDRIANSRNKGDFVALIRSQDKVSKIGSSSKQKGACAIIVPGKVDLADFATSSGHFLCDKIGDEVGEHKQSLRYSHPAWIHNCSLPGTTPNQGRNHHLQG